jgi:hypothetical protein
MLAAHELPLRVAAASVSFSPSLPFFLPLCVHSTVEACSAYCLLLPSSRCTSSCLRRHFAPRTRCERYHRCSAVDVLSSSLPFTISSHSSNPIANAFRSHYVAGICSKKFRSRCVDGSHSRPTVGGGRGVCRGCVLLRVRRIVVPAAISHSGLLHW